MPAGSSPDGFSPEETDMYALHVLRAASMSRTILTTMAFASLNLWERDPLLSARPRGIQSLTAGLEKVIQYGASANASSARFLNAAAKVSHSACSSGS